MPFTGGQDAPETLEQHLVASTPTLVVIDSCNESLAIERLDSNSTFDVSTWIRILPKRIARHGSAVLVIDHVVKNREARGAWATGSQAKKAETDVMFMLELEEPFGIGMSGRSALKVAKDRHGQLRRHGLPSSGGLIRIGDVLVSESAGRTTVDIAPPGAGTGGRFRPTTLMCEVSEAIAGASDSLTTRGVLARVTGRTKHILTALDVLVDEGWVDVEHKGNSKLHRVVTPHTGQDAPVSERFPGVSGNTATTVSPPIRGKRVALLGSDEFLETELDALLNLVPGEGEQ